MSIPAIHPHPQWQPSRRSTFRRAVNIHSSPSWSPSPWPPRALHPEQPPPPHAADLHGSHSIIPCRHRRTRPRSCLQPGEDARVQRSSHTRIRELAAFPPRHDQTERPRLRPARRHRVLERPGQAAPSRLTHVQQESSPPAPHAERLSNRRSRVPRADRPGHTPLAAVG